MPNKFFVEFVQFYKIDFQGAQIFQTLGAASKFEDIRRVTYS